MAMSAVEFGYIRELLQSHSGMLLEEGKEYLAESRLQPLAKLEGFLSVGEMIARLRTASPNGLHRQVVEAMTTNETSFFRDYPAFEALERKVFPDLLRKRTNSKRLSIWCAACSSGQEPYSLAMLLRDTFPEAAGWDVAILATDLSEAMVERGRSGVYSQLEVNRGLPATYLVRHFTKSGLDWVVRPELRAAVEFRRMNLAEPWPSLPSMDLILMRNLLIYLGPESRKAILRETKRVLKRDGYLLLGGAESTHRIDDSFDRVDCGGAALHRLRDDSGETRA